MNHWWASGGMIVKHCIIWAIGISLILGRSDQQHDLVFPERKSYPDWAISLTSDHHLVPLVSWYFYQPWCSSWSWHELFTRLSLRQTGLEIIPKFYIKNNVILSFVDQVFSRRMAAEIDIMTSIRNRRLLWRLRDAAHVSARTASFLPRAPGCLH